MKKSDIRNKILNIRKKKFDPLKKIKFNIIKDFIFNNSAKPVIGGYVPVNYEIDCLNILKKLENEKIKISLPVIKNNNEMEFYRYSFKFPMKINKYGIPEPFKGGYYDRYLAKLEKKKLFKSIGFAFSFQKVNEIPINNFDKKLDLVITENKFYK